MTATAKFIETLEKLKEGNLGLLRTHAGQGLDESVNGFDLFAGLWWPLRKENNRAPRRSVAWLIAKLYAFRPIRHENGLTIAIQLRRCRPPKKEDRDRFRQKFDEMLILPLDDIEPALQWALQQIDDLANPRLDWVKLTDDLSIWERESKRLEWAREFIQTDERDNDNVD
ncbi:type I-E CRISPR-associated protein Cse2/CasB [bacterium]|nr:type I-E CRISPR-associated protein Cse2/CasB [bacterium]